MDPVSLYDIFARLFTYPDGRFRDAVNECRSTIFSVNKLERKPETYDEVARVPNVVNPFNNNLDAFIKLTGNLSLEELEELYTRSFDINPIASLEIGWHLYGETYERGAFLVKMRELLRTFHVEESSELPDHLTHVLMAIGRMEKKEADEFVSRYLIPALNKILEGFQEKDQPFEHALLALKGFIEQQHLQGVETHG